MDIMTARMKLFNLQTQPPFAEEKLLSWHDIAFHDLHHFVVEEERYGSASVNVFRVVGTKHASYAGRSWQDLLGRGVRMEHNLSRFTDNPGYYLGVGPKVPYMQYLSIDGGDMYVGDEGNHRTCIARFYFFTQGLTVLHGVTLLNFKIDWAFKSLCDDFRQTVEYRGLPIYLSVGRRAVERRDATDWKIDKYVLSARVIDSRKHETYEFDFISLQYYLEKLKKPWWKVWQVR